MRIVRPLLDVLDFFDGGHQAIYDAAVLVADRGVTINVGLLVDVLQKAGELEDAGGHEYLAELAAIGLSANVEQCARIVRDYARRRALGRRLESGLEDLGRDYVAVDDLVLGLHGSLKSAYVNGLTSVDPEEKFARPVRAIDVGAPKPIDWTIAELWTAGDIGFVVGDGGSFKSTVALHMALAVAGGRRVFGRFDCAPRPVLFVSEEDPQDVIIGRARALLRGHGWSETDVLTNLHVLALGGASLSQLEWVAQLERYVNEIDAGMVVLDPLTDLIDGDESSPSEMRGVVKAARRLSRKGRTSVLVVHHTGKAKEGVRPIDRVRGASSFHAGARCLYFVEANDKSISVQCLKLSRAPKPERFAVEFHIESEEQNPAMWTLARLDYLRASVAATARAETFIIEQLATGFRLGSTELRDAAKGAAFSNVDLSNALKKLEMSGVIDCENGGRGKKLWGLPTLPEGSRQGAENEAGTLPDGVGRVGTVGDPDPADPARGPGRVISPAPLTLPAPFRGQGQASSIDGSDGVENLWTAEG